eukprot:363234-Amphidinium_carterae.1
METEFDTVEQIPVYVWSVLAIALRAEAFVLRDHVVHSVLVAWSYLQYKLLDTLESLPFALCSMEPSEALNLVREMPHEPKDVVTAKIHRLLSAHYLEEHLLQGLEFLSEASFSSRYTESQHSSTAIMRKYHADRSEPSACGLQSICA